MQLVIMRHGEAAPDFMNDDARELTEHGHQQALAQGQYLATEFKAFDTVAVSPLVRTQQTADAVCSLLSVGERLMWPQLVHSSYANLVDNKVSELAQQRVLLISHMPLVASLESYLIHADENKGSPFATAELSVLSSHDPYPGNWQLIERVKARV